MDFGVSQIKNSIQIEDNFKSIKRVLGTFADSNADVILFPECSLSGFSAKMKECTKDVVKEYLNELRDWSLKTAKTLFVPTGLQECEFYNTGFIFQNGKVTQFYKLGLTESEKKFFSIPEVETSKVFAVNGYNVGLLICFEAQMSAWNFFKPGDVDVILWPGYWEWEKSDVWGKLKTNGDPNLIYENMKEWQVPLIQSNFAFNDLEDHRRNGPHGLSVAIDSDNRLVGQGKFEMESCHIISLEKDELGCRILDFREIETTG